MGKHDTTDLDRARDELFSHIRRCGVLEATPDQREEWMLDTIEYLTERYPSLDRKELGRLKELGDRYCRPAIPHGDAVADDVWDESAETVPEGEAVEPASVEPEAVEPEGAGAEPVETEPVEAEPVEASQAGG
ncbi:MAG: hypothetical protein ACOC83_03350 [Gemmatimonadota bacterium]